MSLPAVAKVASGLRSGLQHQELQTTLPKYGPPTEVVQARSCRQTRAVKRLTPAGPSCDPGLCPRLAATLVANARPEHRFAIKFLRGGDG